MPTDHEIADAMQRYGGSFAQAMGRLFYVADVENQARLKAAYPEVWAEYANVVDRVAARARGEGRE